jgi:tRNA pseudouridine65 synthase
VRVLHQDPQLIIVDKPSGLLVHRGWAREPVVAMSLVRDLCGAYVYPVHRLDRGASGVLVMALSPEAARGMQERLQAGAVDKRYLVLVRGVPPDEGIIDHPIPGKEGGERVPASTRYRRLGSFEQLSLVEARPAEGRLHQVRRHLKHLGHPVIGDANYGRGDLNRALRARFGLARLALHAVAMAFDHPITGERIAVAAPPPPDLAGPLAAMGLLEAALAAARP